MLSVSFPVVLFPPLRISRLALQGPSHPLEDQRDLYYLEYYRKSYGTDSVVPLTLETLVKNNVIHQCPSLADTTPTNTVSSCIPPLKVRTDFRKPQPHSLSQQIRLKDSSCI